MRPAKALLSLATLLLLLPAGPSAGEESDFFRLEWSRADAPRAGALATIGGNAEVLIAVLADGATLRTLDGGATWTATAGLPLLAKPRVAFDPSAPARGYIAAEGGVWRTDDHGASWDRVLAVERAARIDVSATSAVAVAARLSDTANTVLVSRDHGESWSDLAAPIPGGEPICGVAFGSADDVVLTMTDRQSWYTHDGGETWAETAGYGVDFVVERGGPVWRLTMGGVTMSEDDGVTWSDVPSPGVGIVGAPHPAGGMYLAANNGLLVTRDAGASWQNLGYGDQVFEASAILADPRTPQDVLVADERVGLARVDRGAAGASWYHGELFPAFEPVPIWDVATVGDGRAVAIGPHGLFARGEDGGWRHAGAGLGAVGPLSALAVSRDGTHVYSGGPGPTGSPAVEASDDGGRSFFVVPLPSPPATVTHIAVDPGNGARAALTVQVNGSLHDVYETLDGGRTWTRALPGVPLPPQGLAWHGSGALLVALPVGGLVRIDQYWLPFASEGLTAITSNGSTVVATGTALHWQNAGIAAAPVLVPVGRAAPTQATDLELVDGRLWLLEDRLWSCLLEGYRCFGRPLPHPAPLALAADPSTLLLATEAGLFAAAL